MPDVASLQNLLHSAIAGVVAFPKTAFGPIATTSVPDLLTTSDYFSGVEKIRDGSQNERANGRGVELAPPNGQVVSNSVNEVVHATQRRDNEEGLRVVNYYAIRV